VDANKTVGVAVRGGMGEPARMDARHPGTDG